MAVDNTTVEYENPVTCAYAFGRLFYGVNSLVYYSQVLNSPSDAGRCYQNNDPTSTEIPDLLDTDGGVITLEDTRKIKLITPFKSGILVFASNGVWYISNPDGGFKATAYNVEKVTSNGLTTPRSVVVVEDTVLYFSNNGIFSISPNEFGAMKHTDLTEKTIKTYFIETFSNRTMSGVYDEANKRVEWWPVVAGQSGLVFDIQLQAFYPQRSACGVCRLISPFSITNTVYYPAENTDSDEYAFSVMSNRQFKDFGVDQEAYMISGYETLGKFSNKKRSTGAKVLFNKTETQITGYEDGEYQFDFPSSCLFQSRWDFDETEAYGKFSGDTGVTGRGMQIQLYQPMKRGFIPDSYPYDFDTGEKYISRKFSIRGSGDAVQFVFKAEPEKDLQLLGYSVVYDMGARM